MDIKKIDIKKAEYTVNNLFCSNTVLLLKNFRSIATETAYMTVNIKRTLENQYGESPGAFIEVLKKYMPQVIKDEGTVKNIEKLVTYNNILKCIEGYCDSIREYHQNGEKMYKFLYYAYLKKDKLPYDQQLEKISYELDLCEKICYNTYSKYLRQAILELDHIIWSSSNPYFADIQQYVRVIGEKQEKEKAEENAGKK